MYQLRSKTQSHKYGRSWVLNETLLISHFRKFTCQSGSRVTTEAGNLDPVSEATGRVSVSPLIQETSSALTQRRELAGFLNPEWECPYSSLRTREAKTLLPTYIWWRKIRNLIWHLLLPEVSFLNIGPERSVCHLCAETVIYNNTLWWLWTVGVFCSVLFLLVLCVLSCGFPGWLDAPPASHTPAAHLLISFSSRPLWSSLRSLTDCFCLFLWYLRWNHSCLSHSWTLLILLSSSSTATLPPLPPDKPVCGSLLPSARPYLLVPSAPASAPESEPLSAINSLFSFCFSHRVPWYKTSLPGCSTIKLGGRGRQDKVY